MRQRRPGQLRRARAADGRLEGVGPGLAPRPGRDPQVHQAPVADGHARLRAVARRPPPPLRRAPASQAMGEAFAALATSDLLSRRPAGDPGGALRHLRPLARPAGRGRRRPARLLGARRVPRRGPRGGRDRPGAGRAPGRAGRGAAGAARRARRERAGRRRPRRSCASRSSSASATRAPRRWPGSRRCAASPRPSSTRSPTSAPAATRTGTRSATRARSRRRPIVPGRWRCIAPEGAEELIEADVCIVGSGAGGGVIAGELAAAGKSVCVLEMGGYHDDRDFDGLELSAYQRLYLNGGPFPTAEGQVAIVAGTGRRRRHRDQLDQLPAHPRLGARGVGRASTGSRASTGRTTTPTWTRSGSASRSTTTAPTSRARTGGSRRPARKLGYDFRTITRNADRDRYDPESAAYMGFGDQSGSKHSTAKTYLLDAQRAGATIVVRLPGRADPGRGRPRRRGRGRLHGPRNRGQRRLADPGRRPRPRGRRRLRLDRVAGAAACARRSAARPSATTCACIRPPRSRPTTPSRSSGAGARRRRRSRTSSPTSTTATAS